MSSTTYFIAGEQCIYLIANEITATTQETIRKQERHGRIRLQNTYHLCIVVNTRSKHNTSAKKHTINGLTCNGLATKSEFGLKTNVTLSAHGVFVTYIKDSVMADDNFSTYIILYEIQQMMMIIEQQYKFASL